jgi:hypothetical protein
MFAIGIETVENAEGDVLGHLLLLVGAGLAPGIG